MFQKYGRKRRRKVFPDEMERIVPSSVCTTAASVADCGMLLGLLHGEERKV